MTKSELVSKLIEIYTDPGIIVTAAGGIFTFTYGDEVVGKYTPAELMKEAHAVNPSVKERYQAELNASFTMYKYFKEHPELFKSPGTKKEPKIVKDQPLQKIVYGAPGTGKSFGTDDKLKDADGNPKAVAFRTTFHPDSDYSTFVGAYKPTIKKVPRINCVDDKAKHVKDAMGEESYEEKISYEFRAQAFMKAYVSAWKNPTKPVVLVIEEINRGNCAQIFGDLFQLLDRDDATGYSSYPITADTDLAKWLASDEKDEAGKLLQFGKNGVADPGKPACIKDDDWAKVLKGEMLALPPNLYIWATMNTSDQSLFPIDSAFKRRWDWKYVPIREGKHKDGPKKGQPLGWKIDVDGVKYDWWKFLGCINTLIYKTTESEDKKLGYFFVKPDVASTAGGDKDIISADRFVDKVVFYLWNDVFKDYGIESVFKNEQIKKKNDDEDGQAVAFERFFVEDGDKADPKVLVAFFEALDCKPDTAPTPPTEPAAPATELAPAAE